MMIPSKTFLTTLFVVATISFSGQAQEKNPDLQRELTLEKEYSPHLRDANKLNSLPEIKEPEAPKTKVEFSNYTLDYPLSPYFQKLGVINYFPGFADSDQRGYLTGGLGTLFNIDGDAGYQILQSETNRLSIFASHRSSNGNVSYLQKDDVKRKMKINDNWLGVDFLHRFKKAALSADAQYTYSAFNYYGFPPPFLFFMYLEEDNLPEYNFSVNQVNNLMKTHLGLTSAENEGLNYRLNLTHTLLEHRRADIIELTGKTENRILLDVDLYAHINATTGIGTDIAVKTYFYHMPDDLRRISNDFLGNHDYTTIILDPYLTLEGDTWNARLGIKENIQLGGIKKFLLAPDIRFYWRPSDPVLLYLTVDGGIKDNSDYNIYYENRYLNPQYRIYDSRSPLDAKLGLTFSPVNAWSVNLFSAYQWVKKEHFYFNEWYFNFPVSESSATGQKMLPQYADAQVFQLGGSMKYHYQDQWDLGLKVVYNQWKVTKFSDKINTNSFSELIAWNQPVFTGDWNVGYKITAIPLRMDLNYHLETGRKAVDMGSTTIQMKNIHDVNVAATYTIHKDLSVFGKINNLLFQKYDLWYGYPAQGFNIMLGANLKF
ncbi:MAG: hypothetical protein LBB85_09755 [Dysgonamonadaceae bacterium]|jgi:hypothetical protein|nr:hypothetical protein [Dysgonamonadaceae bacterium]